MQQKERANERERKSMQQKERVNKSKENDAIERKGKQEQGK